MQERWEIDKAQVGESFRRDMKLGCDKCEGAKSIRWSGQRLRRLLLYNTCLKECRQGSRGECRLIQAKNLGVFWGSVNHCSRPACGRKTALTSSQAHNNHPTWRRYSCHWFFTMGYEEFFCPINDHGRPHLAHHSAGVLQIRRVSVSELMMGTPTAAETASDLVTAIRTETICCLAPETGRLKLPQASCRAPSEAVTL